MSYLYEIVSRKLSSYLYVIILMKRNKCTRQKRAVKRALLQEHARRKSARQISARQKSAQQNSANQLALLGL